MRRAWVFVAMGRNPVVEARTKAARVARAAMARPSTDAKGTRFGAASWPDPFLVASKRGAGGPHTLAGSEGCVGEARTGVGISMTIKKHVMTNTGAGGSENRGR